MAVKLQITVHEDIVLLDVVLSVVLLAGSGSSYEIRCFYCLQLKSDWQQTGQFSKELNGSVQHQQTPILSHWFSCSSALIHSIYPWLPLFLFLFLFRFLFIFSLFVHFKSNYHCPLNSWLTDNFFFSFKGHFRSNHSAVVVGRMLFFSFSIVSME